MIYTFLNLLIKLDIINIKFISKKPDIIIEGSHDFSNPFRLKKSSNLFHFFHLFSNHLHSSGGFAYVFFNSEKFSWCLIVFGLLEILLLQTYQLFGFLSEIIHETRRSCRVHFLWALILASLIVECLAESLHAVVICSRASSVVHFVNVSYVSVSSCFLRVKLFAGKDGPRSKLAQFSFILS